MDYYQYNYHIATN